MSEINRSVLRVKCRLKPGDRFKMLEVIGRPFAVRPTTPDGKPGRRKACVVCRCDCGEVIAVRAHSLLYEAQVSCGCVHLGGRTHGYSRTPLFWVWASMRQRCINPNHEFYYRYGGRGIQVWEGWNDFSTFRQWSILHGYTPGLQIDRIDNNSGYSPANCRFVTPAVNMRNRGDTVLTEYTAALVRHMHLSEGKSAKEISKLLRIGYAAVKKCASGRSWVGVESKEQLT